MPLPHEPPAWPPPGGEVNEPCPLTSQAFSHGQRCCADTNTNPSTNANETRVLSLPLCVTIEIGDMGSSGAMSEPSASFVYAHRRMGRTTNWNTRAVWPGEAPSSKMTSFWSLNSRLTALFFCRDVSSF
eukprot:UN3937